MFVIVLAVVLGVAPTGGAMAFELTSTAFAPNQVIPAKYTCEGADVSPPLAWKDPPPATKSFALVCDDPDAPPGTWVHWVVWDMPPTLRGLPENLPKTPTLEDGTRQGTNDFKRTGYGGPCPPPGHGPHRYVFKLYAIDSVLGVAPGSTKSALEKAITGHTLARADLIGRYERR
jgi:Raf kinase inhibitor-like YbhB/YbcL family protein